jgi:NAD(P)-dependent dehydrogenase (short-subunit alcohol dehydrogenase family)
MKGMTSSSQPVALVTGGSRGLGKALAAALFERGWRVIIDARDVSGATQALPGVVAVPGDVTDAAHRRDLADLVRRIGRLDLLVNNASTLGPSPLPHLAEYPLSALRVVLEANVVAPLALVQELIPALRASQGVIVDVTSDASVEPYPGWGGYGSAKAALDQLSAVLGAEEPDLRVYAVDPGDMRTDMHQAAFPGEDISDRPEPETVVPAMLRLFDERPASGRYRAADWSVTEVPS